MVMAEKKKQKLEETAERLKKAYNRGQNISRYTEAVTVGYTPLILIIINFVVALSEAALVGWTMENVPHAFLKVAALTLAGAVAAMYVPSRLAFMFQIRGMKKTLKAQVELNQEFVGRTIKKMSATQWRYFMVVLFGGAVSVLSHWTMTTTMIEAFNNVRLTDSLGVTDSASALLSLGIGISITSMAIDILLGFVTNLRVNIEDFYPDLKEEVALIKRAEQYEIFQDEVQELYQKLEEFTTNRANAGNGSGGSSSSSGGGGSGSGSGGGGGGTAPKVFAFPKPTAPLPDVTAITKNPDLIAKVFDGMTQKSVQDITQALANADPGVFQAQVARPLSKSIRKIRALYSQGANPQTWQQKDDELWGKICAEMKKIQGYLKKIGLEL